MVEQAETSLANDTAKIAAKAINGRQVRRSSLDMRIWLVTCETFRNKEHLALYRMRSAQI